MATTYEIITDPFWLEDPSIILRGDRILEFIITSEMSIEEKLNSIVRFSLYTSIILTMYYKNWRYFGLLIATLILTYIVYKNQTIDNMQIVTHDEVKKSEDTMVIDGEERTIPTYNNPFGNPNFTDYNKPKMVDYTSFTPEARKFKQEVKDKFYKRVFRSSDDIYQKKHGLREFYTVPDYIEDVSKFRKWVGGKGGKGSTACKQDTSQCYKNLNHDLRFNRKPILQLVNQQLNSSGP